MADNNIIIGNALSAFAFRGVNDPTLEVRIPEGVEIIGEGAFQGAVLKAVLLPSSLREIGTDAFAGAVLHSGLQLPDGLRSIGSGAFRDCRLPRPLHVPASARVFPNALTGCAADNYEEDRNFICRDGLCLDRTGEAIIAIRDGLRELIIPEGVQYLPREAAVHCPDVQDMYIPASLCAVNLTGFSMLETVTVSPDNPWLQAQDGLVLSKDGTVLKHIPRGLRWSTVVVPDTVTRIVDGDLDDCRNLTELTLPAGLREIYGLCPYSLKTLRIPGELSAIEGMDQFLKYSPDGLAILTDPGQPIEFYEEHFGRDAVRAMLRGFLQRLDTGEPVPAAARAEYLYGIQKNHRVLWDDARFRDFILRQGYITAEEYPEVVEAAAVERDPELTARLLEYRNVWFRHGEVERAQERKMDETLRKLCSTPAPFRDSTGFWRAVSGNARGDGGPDCRIVSLAGGKAEVRIPEKILARRVTGIGPWALSADDGAPGLSRHRRNRLSRIRTVTIPEGVETIAESAFAGLPHLETIRFPESAEWVECGVLRHCPNLRRILLPEGSPLSLRDLGVESGSRAEIEYYSIFPF